MIVKYHISTIYKKVASRRSNNSLHGVKEGINPVKFENILRKKINSVTEKILRWRFKTNSAEKFSSKISVTVVSEYLFKVNIVYTLIVTWFFQKSYHYQCYCTWFFFWACLVNERLSPFGCLWPCPFKKRDLIII